MWLSVSCWRIFRLWKLYVQKKLVAPLIEECTETVEEVKLATITLAENENSHKCPSHTPYIVPLIVVCTICAGITNYCVYYNWS